MRKIVLAVIAVTIIGASAVAQPQQPEPMYQLTLSLSSAQLLYTALQKVPLPREMTDALVADILRQVKDQDEARAKAAAQKAPPPPAPPAPQAK